MKANSKLKDVFSFVVRKISHNLPIKILCLLVAVFLYLFYEMSLIDSETKVIPLSLKNEGGVELINIDHSQVKVVITSKQTVNIKDGDIVPVVNLNYLTHSGKYELPVELSISEELMKIDPLEIKVKPEKVSVHVERKIAGAARIKTNISGEPAHGYEVRDILVVPEMVNIIGPESVIKNTDIFYTEGIDINGLDRSQKTRKSLRELNRMIDIEEGKEVFVEINIEPVITTKVFNNVSPVFKNKNPDFEYNSLSRDLSISVTGPMLLLEQMIDDAVFFDIDLSNVTETGDYVFPISFNFDKRISVTEKSFTDWNLQVTLKEQESPDEFSEENSITMENSVIE